MCARNLHKNHMKYLCHILDIFWCDIHDSSKKEWTVRVIVKTLRKRLLLICFVKQNAGIVGLLQKGVETLF